MRVEKFKLRGDALPDKVHEREIVQSLRSEYPDLLISVALEEDDEGEVLYVKASPYKRRVNKDVEPDINKRDIKRSIKRLRPQKSDKEEREEAKAIQAERLYEKLKLSPSFRRDVLKLSN